MKLVISIFMIGMIFCDDSSFWGCKDESAINYDPYVLWDCDEWCCEYEDENNYGIVINEINYNPGSSYDQSDEDYEFIEFYNNGSENINLHGWYFGNTSLDNCFVFEDVVIPSGGYLLLARNANMYPGSVDYGIHNYLSNSEATLTLRDHSYNIVDQVTYKDDCECNTDFSCWPTNADEVC